MRMLLTAQKIELGRRLLNDRRLARGPSTSCASLHVGPTLTDEKRHNTGVAWQDGRLSDPGDGRGDFKTPTLREVGRSSGSP